MARHVRTEAGVHEFHEGIGGLIGHAKDRRKALAKGKKTAAYNAERNRLYTQRHPVKSGVPSLPKNGLDFSNNWAKWDLARDRGKKVSKLDSTMRNLPSDRLSQIGSAPRGTLNNPGAKKKAATRELMRRAAIRREFESGGHLAKKPTIIRHRDLANCTLKSDIDLTRHVRTPAGQAYFHRPIGSPIGGGSAGHKVVKAAERAATTSNPANDFLHPAKVTAKRPPTSVAKRSSRVGKTRSTQPTIKLDLTEDDANEARKSVTSNVESNLWQLDNKRLTEAMQQPNISAERLTALKREKAARITKMREILGKKDETDKAIKAAGDDPGKIRSAVHKHAPKVIADIFDKVTAHGRKIKDADHAQSIADAIWDWFVKTVFSIGALALAAHTGIILGG